MNYLPELRGAIRRFVTADGATAAEIADSFCDVEGFTPPPDKITAGLVDLELAGEVRSDGDLYFWHETDGVRF
jgi:hypothetical protein